MVSCENLLWDVVRRIEPTQAQKEAAQRSHLYLRSLLTGGDLGVKIIKSYLGGSYSRDTAIRPIDDVDIIFLIDPARGQGELEKLLNIPPEPINILNVFAKNIRSKYPVSSVLGQRRSIRLELYHLDIDVVPALSASQDGKIIKIPDAAAKNWILTSPILHSEKAATVNQYQNGKFKPLVKLLKYWNQNLPDSAQFKSFAIETMAVRIFSTIQYSSLEYGMTMFFDFVAFLSGNQTVIEWKNSCGMSFGLFHCIVPDVAELSGNVAADVSMSKKNQFIKFALQSRARMQAAYTASSSDVANRRIVEALEIR